MKKAIFLCDKTGFMAAPWREAGYECWLFDAQHPEGAHKGEDGIWRVGGWLNTPDDVIRHTGTDDIAIVVSFPECTHLAISGNRWVKAKLEADPLYQEKAMALVYLCRDVGVAIGCPWVLENPVGVIPRYWRLSDHTFNPHEYGGYLPVDDVNPVYPEIIAARDAYPKKTLLWCGNGFKMPVRKPVGPCGVDLVNGRHPDPALAVTLTSNDKPLYTAEGAPLWQYSNQFSQLGGKSTKTKNIRSATPRGFALAVYQAQHGITPEDKVGKQSTNLLELIKRGTQ